MKFRRGTMLAATAALCMAGAVANAAEDAVDTHLRAAKEAAGQDFVGTLVRTCIAPGPLVPNAGGGGGNRAVPDRSTWYAEPAKMFDNLYFLGTKIHSSWALTTSAGIILIDTLYDYANEEEIIGGMKKLGLNPADIKYVLISHGHGDHDEGAKMLQDRYGAKVVMGAPDWDNVLKMTNKPGGIPKRDINGTDGQKITLGDTTVTVVSTPGHTPGTLSFMFQVKDGGKPLTVAYAGGTALQVIYRDVAKLEGYSDSQKRFAQLAASQNATVIMSNHTEFDSAYLRGRLLATRKSGEAHPYDVGKAGVGRYFTVMSECALAQAERLKRPNS